MGKFPNLINSSSHVPGILLQSDSAWFFPDFFSGKMDKITEKIYSQTFVYKITLVYRKQIVYKKIIVYNCKQKSFYMFTK